MIQPQTTAHIEIKDIQRIVAAYTIDVEDVVWRQMESISQTLRDQTLLRAIFGLAWWVA